jgi:Amt family ammonium transporter
MEAQDLQQLTFALDTFYLLICGALVMWMAAGFSMLEAGLVRAKNTTEILTKNIALYSIACMTYLAIGYKVMYPDPSPAYAADANFFFQVVFVATAMSIVSGAVAERMKLMSFLVFCVVLSAFIYPVQGLWSWGGGMISNWGFVDFAGSSIVHLTGASAALAAGTIAALLFTKLLWKKADLTMILNGALAGLVAITAQPVTPEPWLASVFGFAAGLMVVLSIIALDKLHIDDPVGAISVHGVVGIFGTLVVPISDPAASFMIQLAGVATIFGWVFACSFIIWTILKLTVGIRVTKEQEYVGLDQVDCGVEAYPEFTSQK